MANKKYIYLFITLLSAINLLSQNISINDNGAVANSAAILDIDISSNDKGLLIPRLSLTERKSIPGLGLTEDGLTVYDTDTKCYWLWDGTQWVRFRMFDIFGNDSWILGGNYSTIDGVTNVIGTLDNVALNFKVAGQKAGRIDFTGSTFFGYKAGNVNTQITNSGFGFQSLVNNTNGLNNSAFGFNAMYANLTGNSNTSFGYSALSGNVGGNNNTAFGSNTLLFNTSGNENTAIGTNALYKNISGISNIAIGKDALYENTASFNTAIGNQALIANSTGDGNSAFGIGSLRQNVSGSNNSAFGGDVMIYNTTGNYNTALGTLAGMGISNSDNVTCVGYFSGQTVTASNRVYIGNTSINYIGGQVGWSVFSDKRIKTNIKENVPGLQFIIKLKPVTYNLDIDKQYEITNPNKKDTTPNWDGKYDIENLVISGFLAQDVEAVANSINYDFSGITPPKNETDLYSIRYADFVPPIIKAIQEQQKEIENLKLEIEKMKQEHKTKHN